MAAWSAGTDRLTYVTNRVPCLGINLREWFSLTPDTEHLAPKLYRPTASRAASSSGRPARCIFSCAAARS